MPCNVKYIPKKKKKEEEESERQRAKVGSVFGFRFVNPNLETRKRRLEHSFLGGGGARAPMAALHDVRRRQVTVGRLKLINAA